MLASVVTCLQKRCATSVMTESSVNRERSEKGKILRFDIVGAFFVRTADNIAKNRAKHDLFAPRRCLSHTRVEPNEQPRTSACRGRPTISA